jgi:hypothetical protein
MNKKYYYLPTDRICSICGQEHKIYQLVSVEMINSNHNKNWDQKEFGLGLPKWQHEEFLGLVCKKCNVSFSIPELLIDLEDNRQNQTDFKKRLYQVMAQENEAILDVDILNDEGKLIIKAKTKIFPLIKNFFSQDYLEDIELHEALEKKICVTLEPDMDAPRYYISKDSLLKKLESK